MTCTSCDGALEDVNIKGYRMMVDVGKTFGPIISTRVCTECGLIHFFDPRYADSSTN